MGLIKKSVGWILWKLLGRDCLVLRPGWRVVQRSEHFSVVAPAQPNPRALPVRYNGCTPFPWVLEYEVIGQDRGTLSCRWSVPGKEPFCEFRREVTLPFTLKVRLEGQELSANEEVLGLIPGATLPRDTPHLVGEFTFESSQGSRAARRTAHRVVLEPESGDKAYFHGGVYDDYEMRPGMFPEQILTAIGRHHAPRGRFLDVGCATGLLVRHAHACGFTADGVDVSPWAVAKANEALPGSARVLDFDHASAHDFVEPYHAVVLHSVLEHLGDPARALRLLFELLVPGGVVYLQTLNSASLMHQLRGPAWSGYADYTHRSPWLTGTWLEKTSRELGFEIVESKCYGIWNETPWDETWNAFGQLMQVSPASALLEEGGGDFVAFILRRPDCPA